MTSVIDGASRAAYADAAMSKARVRGKKRVAKTPLTVMVSVRLPEDDAARLDELAKTIPVASRHAIAREALRIGLDALERDPSRLIGSPRRSRR